MAIDAHESSESSLDPTSSLYAWTYPEKWRAERASEADVPSPETPELPQTIPAGDTEVLNGQSNGSAKQILAEMPSPEQTDGGIDEIAEILPVAIEAEKLSLDGLKKSFARLRNFGRRMWYSPLLTSMNHTPVDHELTSELRDIIKSNRRRRIGIAAGGVALSLAAAWGVSRGFHVGGNSSGYLQNHLNTGPLLDHHSHAKTVGESLPKAAILPKLHLQPEHKARIIHHAAKSTAKAREYRETLKYHGDTIWNHVQDRVRVKFANLSEHRRTQLVIKLTNQALKLNPKTNPNNMAVGESFQLPEQLR